MAKFLLGFFSFGWLRGLDFLPPLLLRLFLAPLFWISGSQKLGLFTADFIWFNPLTWANPETVKATADTMSNLPFIGSFSNILPYAIGGLEVVGALLLFIGLAVRWVSLPLLVLIALTAFLSLGGESIIVTLKSLLMTHGYADMSNTMFGKSVVYFLMLLTLFFMGAGRFFSVDWFMYRRLLNKIKARHAGNIAQQTPASRIEDPFELDNTTDKKIA